MSSLRELQDRAHGYMIDKGWTFTERDIPEKLCLMHSEISEALEEYRKGHKPEDVYYSEGNKPEGIGTELADVVIRVLTFCAMTNIDLQKVLLEKMAYNDTRPHRHGGLKA